ncbi:chorismate-binding protein [Cellulomonas cellasea]|uniref:Para-aminobenzoate synthetase component 1 n=1 Tax=Cellulomonas cellasea TaxID=43670 RepID=A0A7W4UDT6_9CELL|nr:chorismate-binding protein [Cellulomonas cellasea]MBB2921815.1 para-aminobenzoate synthetase component 1 [Cellulomonas cellasea]
MQVSAPIRPSDVTPRGAGEAWFSGVRAWGAAECIDVVAEPERLREPGFWVVVGEFEGRVRAWRFTEVERADADRAGAGSARPDPGAALADAPEAVGAAARAREASAWRGPAASAWTSSLDQRGYEAAVRAVQDEIRAGEVYQANLCRVLSAPLGGAPGEPEPDARALAAVLEQGNPAPFAGGVHVPGGSGVDPVWVVSASPELFLRVEGDVVTSSPIKGTATTAEGLSAKDEAENVMITDLVRNDLQRVSLPGTVEVTALLALERHPGLVHLVSTVQGRLAPDVLGSSRLWRHLLDATFPPGSVSGAPKSSALRIIRRLEPVPRGPYCGAVGWVDVAEDGSARAELAVGIRSFWWARPAGEPAPGRRGLPVTHPPEDPAPGGPAGAGTLRFGTGAGITWGSDAGAEWRETELKAARLVALASRGGPPVGDWAP